MPRISDFKLAELLIKRLCKSARCPFVNLDICFEEPEGEWSGSGLKVGKSMHVAQTIYRIVQAYVDTVKEIDGTSLFTDERLKQDFLISTSTFLRRVAYSGSNKEEWNTEEFNASRLYQKSLVWTILKNLICPIYDKDLINYQIIAGASPEADIAVFCDVGFIDGEEPKEPFIFMNMGIDNIPIRNVFILLASIEAMGLCPYTTIKDILESELSEKLIGIVKLAFDEDEDIETFVFTLIAVLGYYYAQDFPDLKLATNVDKMIKEAQYFNNPAMWWYFGIIEKLLEPARGSDWTTYESLEPYVKEFWDKVEKYKKAKNISADGVPFEVLLRIKSEDFKTDPTRTLQSLLGSERIW